MSVSISEMTSRKEAIRILPGNLKIRTFALPSSGARIKDGMPSIIENRKLCLYPPAAPAFTRKARLTLATSTTRGTAAHVLTSSAGSTKSGVEELLDPSALRPNVSAMKSDASYKIVLTVWRKEVCVTSNSSLTPRQSRRMTFESVDKFRQDPVECHFNPTPVRNRRGTKRMILIFFKSLIKRTSKDLN
jgi:hypothetical protein